MKKLILVFTSLLLIVSLKQATVNANAEVAPFYLTPGGNDFYYYFEDAFWQQREYKELGYKKGWCLTIIPNQDRDWGASSRDRNQAWNHILARFGNDYRWENENIMRDQFDCHVRYNFFKQTWNIEPWRTSSNWFTCN